MKKKKVCSETPFSLQTFFFHCKVLCFTAEFWFFHCKVVLFRCKLLAFQKRVSALSLQSFGFFTARFLGSTAKFAVEPTSLSISAESLSISAESLSFYFCRKPRGLFLPKASPAVVAVIPDRFSLKVCLSPIAESRVKWGWSPVLLLATTTLPSE